VKAAETVVVVAGIASQHVKRLVHMEAAELGHDDLCLIDSHAAVSQVFETVRMRSCNSHSTRHGKPGLGEAQWVRSWRNGAKDGGPSGAGCGRNAAGQSVEQWCR
jgi:hypothetical protein